MRQFLDFLRCIFISFEFLWVIIIFFVRETFPNLFETIGIALSSEKDIIKYLPAIPIALSGFSISMAWRILTPTNSNRELYDYPDYWRIKLRTILAILAASGSAAIAVSIWFFSPHLNAADVGSLFSGAIGISAITCLSMLFAAFSIREILEPDEKD